MGQKGVAHGLGINQTKVNSPTFVLLNVYEGRLPLFHFDFYRLNKPEEIASIGYDEFLYGNGVSVVEWAERFGDLIPKENLKIYLSYHKGKQERLFKILAGESRYHQLLQKLIVNIR